MSESLRKQKDLGEFDDLLFGSIQRHEDILTLFKTVNNDMGDNNPSTLESKVTAILQLQEKAALADYDLIAILKEMNPTVSAHLLSHPLMNKRQEIMQQILTHNRSLLSVVNNIKSLLAHDIKEMQGGRAALNGYRQTSSSQNGGIVNHAR